MYKSQHYTCSASLVLFNNPPQMVMEALKSIPSSVQITIVDNSPQPDLGRIIVGSADLRYHHTGSNLGYGKGHNLGVALSPPAEYHLILNPDISCHPDTVDRLVTFIAQHPAIGLVGPRLIYPDGTPQYLNRRHPTVSDIVMRRFPAPLLTHKMRQRIHKHEMQDIGYDTTCDVDCISGAFMLCRRAAFEQIGGFDERYFMYFEDVDLCCALRKSGWRTVYYPAAVVTHHWKRASAKQLRLTFVHIQSMLYFFNKWGWKWR